MNEHKASSPILMVDDDKDDRMMTERALRKNRVINPMVFLEDGEELISYLKREGKFADPKASPRPCLILLDLNMPRMDGRRALEILKADADFKKIPVVILTTSQAEEDIIRSYETGANSFITKPVSFDGLLSVMETLKSYWLEIVDLPAEDGKAQASK